MPGEPILIVDDTPVNLKLTRVLLVNEGYQVLTAASAEEALELLHTFHPHLILADIQLPGMDGLELTRRVKEDNRTSDISVVALTAFAMKGDEQRAFDAGCDGYITKPIDTRALGVRIRQYLDRRAESAPALAPTTPEFEYESIPPTEMQSLRDRFLNEGQEHLHHWIAALDGHFNANDAAQVVHQWIGAAGLLGYTAISRLAREAETVLQDRPVDQTQLRESFSALSLAFSDPKEARDAEVPDALLEVLSGKQIALVGLPPRDAQRLSTLLRRARATLEQFAHTEKPAAAAVQNCDLVVVHVHLDTIKSPWLSLSFASAALPLVLVGAREHLLALDQHILFSAREFLMDPWQPEEALVRLGHAVSIQAQNSAPASAKAAPSAAASSARPRILIADDDPTVLTLVRAALENFGMECLTATNGRNALEIARGSKPQAAVLDVNMPGMDGYEVLTAIRSEDIPMRVLLLTARQQESDITRGFSLGADDYVVKPFGPMELVSRLKRLLWR